MSPHAYGKYSRCNFGIEYWVHCASPQGERSVLNTRFQIIAGVRMYSGDRENSSFCQNSSASRSTAETYPNTGVQPKVHWLLIREVASPIYYFYPAV